MIYLSQLLLNPACHEVQRDVCNPYQMHRTLCKAFGSGPDQLSAARCLFRLEEGGDGPRVLVQSLLSPDWRLLATIPGYLAAPPATKAFAPIFTVGQRLAFRLHANPTVKRQGKRQGLHREEEQHEWLERKAKQSGFAICSAVARRPHLVDCEAAAGRSVHFLGVTFEGVLRVTDPARLARAIAYGIGSGKAFGFGLLSLAKP